MTDIAVRTIKSGLLVNALTDDPEITIQRMDTGAAVVTDSPMTDTGIEGLYTFAFTGVRGLRYSFLIDADPSVTGQTDVRFFDGSFDREVFDLYRTRGLDPSISKTTTEVVEKVDFDEDVGDIHIDQVKAGAVTTTSST